MGAAVGTAVEDGAAVTQYALPGGSALQVTGAYGWDNYVADHFALTVDGVPSGDFYTRNGAFQGVSYDGQRGFTLNPADEFYQNLAQGQTRTVSVTYNLYDQANATYTPASVTWTVTGRNDAPVVSEAVTGVAVEGSAAVTLDALAKASDIDQGTVLSVTGLPAKLPAGVTWDAVNHSLTLDPTNAAYASLADGQTKVVTVAYKVSDGITTTDASASWTVEGTGIGTPIIPEGAGQYVVSLASSGITWSQARSLAKGLGGDLVSINSQAEDELLKTVLSSEPQFNIYDGYNGNENLGSWIGLYQKPGSAEPNAGWVWTDGSKPDPYSGWSVSEPDDIFGNENYGHYLLYGSTVAGWNDLQDDPISRKLSVPRPISFIAEFGASTTALNGRDEADFIIGGAVANRIDGRGGNDTLVGGAGPDTLTGGEGADVFYYAKPSSGRDSISDFVSSVDHFEFSAVGFSGLVAGNPATLVVDGTLAAGLAGFTYSTANHTLAFDADGAGGNAAIEIARLNATATLNASDIWIV